MHSSASPRHVYLVHAAIAVIAFVGCSKSPKDTPGSKRTFEAPGSGTGVDRFSGALGGHKFTIIVEGGQVTRSEPAGWTWKSGNGEVSIQEVGPTDADTHFLVERSPRTIVRGNDGFTIVTEVVLVAAGRVFRCAHEERVADPDAPAAKQVVDRGIAVCTSLRIEP